MVNFFIKWQECDSNSNRVSRQVSSHVALAEEQAAFALEN